jgi:SWI/SNF-related matrix-associated actin-dependent regulator of chromatin subfamily A-like protein 1
MLPPLLPAQVKALDALAHSFSMVGLAPGSGKSRLLIEYSRAIEASLTFIVAPAVAVTGVWPSEAKQWAPEINVALLRALRDGSPCPPPPSLIVTSPDLLVASAAARKIALGLPIDLLCWDEAHMGKSPGAARTKFVWGKLAPRAKRTIAMSGTFVLNHAGELHPHLAALAPEKITRYPNYTAFTRRFCTFGYRHVPGRAQPLEVVTGSNTTAYPELREVLAGVLFKLPKAEVEAGLPPLRTRIVPLPAELLDTGAIAELERSAEAAQLREAVAAGDLSQLEGHLSRLRRLFALIKVDAVAAWVESALDEGEPAILLFGWHVEALERLHAKLAHRGAALITGSTPAAQRDAAVAKLQSGAIRILIAQILAGGVAVTAHRAHRVIFAESSWVPALNSQAAARAHRLGQAHPVLVDQLVAPGLDEAVVGLLAKKSFEIRALEGEAA